MSAFHILLRTLLAAAEPAAPTPVVYVHAASNATLRAAPRNDADVLAMLPRGTAIQVAGPVETREILDGLGGGWVRVRAGLKSGYLFDGFLLPYHAAPLECPDLYAWAEQIGHTGPRGAMSLPCDPQQPGCAMWWRTPLVGGGFLEENIGYLSGGQALSLPGITKEQAWAGARNCFATQPNLQHMALPTVAGPAPALGPGAQSIVDHGHAGWIFPGGPGGCFTQITVGETPGAAVISFLGGC